MRSAPDNYGIYRRPHFQPYFQALRLILSGTAVPDLERIRESCNQKQLRDPPKPDRGCSLDMMATTFIADAENRILQGADPAEVYSVLHRRNDTVQISTTRERARQIMEAIVREYGGAR